MASTYRAHIFKQRQVGEREEVKIKFFNADGTSLELDGNSSSPSDGGSTSTGAMIWKGLWLPGHDFNANDVVQYDAGDGLKTYIYTEDVSSGMPAINDIEGHPVTNFWGANQTEMKVVIDQSSPQTSRVHFADSSYVAVAVRTVSSGNIRFSSALDDGVSRDMFGALFKLDPDGITWTLVTTDDDNAGNAYPLFSAAAQPPGTYLLVLTTFQAGKIPPAMDGRSKIDLDPVNNTAGIGGFTDFPMDKVVLLGIGEPAPSAG
jgi:hypothetical protein